MRQMTRSEVRIRVGRWIAECRAERGLTQKELAEHIGTTQATVSNYENAIRDIPLYLLLGMIEAFGADAGSTIRQLMRS